MQPVIDVVGIGNAIVDVISSVPESFITQHDLKKGGMTLIDAERSAELYSAMPAGIQTSGGSVANTMVGVASFGGKAAYMGKVQSDRLGKIFAHDIRSTGVIFDSPYAASGPPTARCLIQVTPDAERTMNTYLGISACLCPSDIDTDTIAAARITYCEGYLWSNVEAKEAIRTAIAATKDANRIVSMTLSDSFVVKQHRSEWLNLIADNVDVLFANEDEVYALTLADDLNDVCKQIADMTHIGVITRGPKGSLVVTGKNIEEIPAVAVPKVVDLTGAGDLYAAGFLWGLCSEAPLRRCAELATLAASEVISHTGARPLIPLSQLLPEEDNHLSV